MQALVVDDSRTIRLLLKNILAQAGFQTCEAENGRDALLQLGKVGPTALALVDWNMPEMDGIEFIRTIRADPAYKPLRVIMVTTEAEDAKRQTALNAGADAYVLKPFTAQTVLAALEQLGLSEPAQR